MIYRKWFAIGVISLIMVGCGKESQQTADHQSGPVINPPQTIPPLKEFLQEITVSEELNEIKANDTVIIPVNIKNVTKENWPTSGTAAGGNVELAYHWLDKSGKEVVRDGLRTSLSKNLAPGDTTTVRARIKAPAVPGDYILRISMVQEGVSWFEWKGAKPLDIPVSVVNG
jgi:uncharacterized protein YcfL